MREILKLTRVQHAPLNAPRARTTLLPAEAGEASNVSHKQQIAQRIVDLISSPPDYGSQHGVERVLNFLHVFFGFPKGSTQRKTTCESAHPSSEPNSEHNISIA